MPRGQYGVVVRLGGVWNSWRLTSMMDEWIKVFTREVKVWVEIFIGQPTQLVMTMYWTVYMIGGWDVPPRGSFIQCVGDVWNNGKRWVVTLTVSFWGVGSRDGRGGFPAMSVQEKRRNQLGVSIECYLSILCILVIDHPLSFELFRTDLDVKYPPFQSRPFPPPKNARVL